MKKLKYITGFLYYFLKWFGAQNHYAFDRSGSIEELPKKPHFWKTRFGVSTAFNLAKIIMS